MGNLIDRLLEIIDDLADGKSTVFAKNAGIPPSTFQYYVKGRMPHGDHLKRICEYYNVNINWLLTGKGKKHIEGKADGEEGMEQPLNLELDVDLLADIIESVDIVLEKEKIELPLNKKARFIALQYELCIETGKGITSDKIKRHLKLVA